MNEYLELKAVNKRKKEILLKAESEENKKKKDDKSTQKSKNKKKGGVCTDLWRDMDKWIPTVVMWEARILIGIQAYMYHNILSLLHLMWILMTFIFPIKLALFLSLVIMTPMYTYEFVMIYGSRIPKL